MADKWFFDDDILRLEAGALVKAAERSAHSQPVRDCRILLISGTFLVVLRFNRERSCEQCGGFGSGQTSHGVHELAFFRGPPGLERREIVGRRLLLLNFPAT